MVRCGQENTGPQWDDVDRRIQGPSGMMWTGEYSYTEPQWNDVNRRIQGPPGTVAWVERAAHLPSYLHFCQAVFTINGTLPNVNTPWGNMIQTLLYV
jgi:hypothetical protein